MKTMQRSSTGLTDMATSDDRSSSVSCRVCPPVHTVLVWSVMVESVSYVSVIDLLPLPGLLVTELSSVTDLLPLLVLLVTELSSVTDLLPLPGLLVTELSSVTDLLPFVVLLVF